MTTGRINQVDATLLSCFTLQGTGAPVELSNLTSKLCVIIAHPRLLSIECTNHSNRDLQRNHAHSQQLSIANIRSTCITICMQTMLTMRTQIVLSA